jgi:haloacid dehalogenase superfamily, subfamily IA, variant 3 with third motif having DD or ED/haloacid dehalogenase superfamily, subfamily IA, variant 1 with third motif having Dx(3-4)D or Dx(3-4)E
MSIRGVAFDLDYTLAVPDRDRETLLAEAVDQADAPPISRREYIQAHRNHLTTESRAPIFAELLGGDATDTDPDRLAAAYREAVTTALVPIPDAEQLLGELRADYRVGLLTNGPVRAQRSKIEYLDWEPLFDTTLVTGELAAGKPDVAAFDALLAELGTAPEETVFIGDTPTRISPVPPMPVFTPFRWCLTAAHRGIRVLMATSNAIALPPTFRRVSPPSDHSTKASGRQY